jgi:hypothetical protein
MKSRQIVLAKIKDIGANEKRTLGSEDEKFWLR